MSIDVMSSVWKHSKQKGTALLLLLAIADSANDYGEAYPGITFLCQKCRMKERNLQTLIKQLEESGELIVQRHEGQNTPTGKTNLYTVITPGALKKPGVQSVAPLTKQAPQGVQPSAPLSPQGVQNPVARGAKLRNQGVQQTAPNPYTLTELTNERESAPAPVVSQNPLAIGKTSPPIYQEPAIQAVQTTLGYKPTKTQCALILDSVTDLKCWQEALTYWAANNYRADSIGKIINRYQETRARSPVAPVPSVHPDALAELERNRKLQEQMYGD